MLSKIQGPNINVPVIDHVYMQSMGANIQETNQTNNTKIILTV